MGSGEWAGGLSVPSRHKPKAHLDWAWPALPARPREKPAGPKKRVDEAWAPSSTRWQRAAESSPSNTLVDQSWGGLKPRIPCFAGARKMSFSGPRKPPPSWGFRVAGAKQATCGTSGHFAREVIAPRCQQRLSWWPPKPRAGVPHFREAPRPAARGQPKNAPFFRTRALPGPKPYHLPLVSRRILPPVTCRIACSISRSFAT